MRASAAVLALILLAGCSAPPAAPVVPSGPETVLAVQPATVPAFSNANPPKGTIGATLWGPVETLPAPPSGVTSADGIVDIVIDSTSIPGNVAARGGLGTIVLGYSLPTLRQATWYRQSYRLRVPRADHSALGVAQVVAYFNLHDRTSRTNLWLGQIAYDTRCIAAGGAKWDPGTNTPLYNVRAQGIACAPFGEWRQMSFAVGPAQIVAAVSTLRARFPTLKLSGNPADYSLTHSNINPEVYVRSGETARIDVSIKDWKLSTMP